MVFKYWFVCLRTTGVPPASAGRRLESKRRHVDVAVIQQLLPSIPLR